MDKPTQIERDFYRAPAKLTVTYGPDTAEARQMMAIDGELWAAQSQLENAAQQAAEDASTSESLLPLLDLLRWIDYKLDLVLYHLRIQQIAKYLPHHTFTTDISGSGIGLAQSGDLQTGQRIVISLVLPDAPGRPIMAVGVVARADSQTPGDQAQAAVKLVEIAESDQERLIRFNFHQQRKDLARRAMED